MNFDEFYGDLWASITFPHQECHNYDFQAPADALCFNFVGLGDCSEFGCILAYDLEFVSETAAVVISTDSRAPPTMSLSSSRAASITTPLLNQTTCTNYTTPTLVQFRPHQTRPAHLKTGNSPRVKTQ
jgi:hypothetical protein